MDSGKRGINPVAMTIINPRKEYWPSRRSNQRPPVLKTATLPTELWDSASQLNEAREPAEYWILLILSYCFSFGT